MSERPLRVLYVVSLFPCWSETFIVREIEQLLELGVDVRIFSLKHPSERLVQDDARALLQRVLYPAPAWSLADRTTTARAIGPLLRSLGRHPAALVKSLAAAWRASGAIAAIRALAPDVIHAHWATYPSTAALLLSRATGIPFGFTSHAHDLFVEDHLLGPKLAEASYAVTISQFNKRWLAERYAKWAGKVRVVHCGLPLAAYPFDSSAREPGAILSVGRLDGIKGFETLIDACALLRDAGVRFRCEIVGEGPLRGALEAQVARLDLSQRVALPGALPQAEVRRRLYAASVFALASTVTADGNRDGIPVALMEAMAVGTPVVSTTVSGIPELVCDGVSGRLVPPADPAALAAALRSLLSEPCEPLRANARATVEREFDVAREAGRLLEMLQEAARSAR